MVRKLLVPLLLMVLLISSSIAASAATSQVTYSTQLEAGEEIFIRWSIENLYFDQTSNSNTSNTYEIRIQILQDLGDQNFTEIINDFDTYVDITINDSQTYPVSLLRDDFAITRLIVPVTYENGSNYFDLKVANTESNNTYIENNNYTWISEASSPGDFWTQKYDIATGILLNETYIDKKYGVMGDTSLQSYESYEYYLINSSITMGQDITDNQLGGLNLSLVIVPAVLVVYLIRRKIWSSSQ